MSGSAPKSLDLVFKAIDMLNDELPAALKIHKAIGTVLMGGGSYLDSLQLINLLVFLDDLVSESTGRPISLAEDAELLEDLGPLHSIGALATYLDDKMSLAQ